MDWTPLFGLAGILLAAIAAEFNDQVTTIALVDVRGALGVSADPGTWIQSLYVSAEIVGMAVSPWMLATVTLRRWTLASIALCAASTVLIPFSPNIEALYALRLLQGLSEGLIIPLLLTTALRALPPPIRIYGLAAYALTASFTPAVAAALAALWTDVVRDWRFVFFQTVPLCLLAAALVWYGDPQDEPDYDRFRRLDWRGLLLIVVGFGALSTLLYQGDRLDWFNSEAICVLALLSAVAIPLLLVNEWFHPLPLIKLQLLGRRNITYGIFALFIFLIVGQSGTTLPLMILRETQGYRPLQGSPMTLAIALPQLVLLPATAFLLDFRHVDSRVVSVVGYALVLASCIGEARVDVTWVRDQFYPWQALQAVGQPFVVMSLLLMATNAVRGPEEAPFASALFNTPRAVSEAVGAWLFQLIQRWRGDLHSTRLIDQIGQNRFQLAQNGALLRMLPAPPGGQAPDASQALSSAVQQQVTILSAGDAYLILGALALLMMVVVAVLPVRTLPPRIQLAKP